MAALKTSIVLRNLTKVRLNVPKAKLLNFSSSYCPNRALSDTIDHSVMSKKFNVCHIDPEGQSAVYDVPKSTFYNELGLSARDLRFQHSHMLSARNGKMIIRIRNLRAVICPNAVLFVDPQWPQQSSLAINESSGGSETLSFCEQLPALLTGKNLHTKHLPFEYRVLEAIFSHSIYSMTSEINELEPKIRDLLETLTDPINLQVDRSLVHILLQCNASLNRFSTLVKEYCQLFNDILDYEEDIKDLCISIETDDHVRDENLYHAYVFTPNNSDGKDGVSNDENIQRPLQGLGKPKQYRINLLDEMEMLLDYFLKEGEDLSNKVSELKQAIENSNSAILINLDSHRNMLLKLELQLTMVMFACTYFGMLGMAFGMNLNSSLEENPVAFWIVSGTMFLGAGAMWLVLARYMNKGQEYIFGKGAYYMNQTHNSRLFHKSQKTGNSNYDSTKK